MYQDFLLTLGAAPSTDVASVVVGQNLTRGRQAAELDVAVEGGWSGEAQESNVVPDKIAANMVLKTSIFLFLFYFIILK